MVDFRKKIGIPSSEKKIHPVDIYNSSDRMASVSGPIRPIQGAILNNWFDNFKNEKDVILKLHTGQGKTLIGLLILQSSLNEGKGPALYLCPNNYLIQQTRDQAELFGIKTVAAPGDLPSEFLDGKVILVTSVQKLFHGYTKFKLGLKSEKVSTIVIDDAHACIDSIRDSFIIRIEKDATPYKEIFQLFAADLKNQGAGTYFDINGGSYDSFLPVPYWAWNDKSSEVTSILSRFSSEKYITFKWPILKDIIKHCECIISGDHLEITPYVNPIDAFGSYYQAKHRIYMSATVNDDSFFVKSLGVDVKAVKFPLIYEDEKWSGEKMILLPELIDEKLTKKEIVNRFAKPSKNNFGTVILTPSKTIADNWAVYGATVTDTNTLISEIQKLKDGKFDTPLVIPNRYDGIDLPDKSCRILILDSKPFAQNLSDLYEENTRTDSDLISVKIAQKIEQGLGRAVRSEKDYCVIILTGFDLVKTVRSRSSQKFFSSQTKTQIEIGLEIAQYSEDDINAGKEPLKVLVDVISQCLRRDEGWKDFYKSKMDSMPNEAPREDCLEILALEKTADQKFINLDYNGSVKVLQNIIDSFPIEVSEKGWYLQEMAKYIYEIDQERSNKLHISAHKSNRNLLKPREGMKVEKIILSQKRILNIKQWIQKFSTYSDLKLSVDAILANLFFGCSADKFEFAINELGTILGFKGERPDKEWKEGPDNLWCVRDNEYILFECKNEVSVTRSFINKEETKQMNNSIAWFRNNYGDVPLTSILIIPTNKFGKGAGLPDDVGIMMIKQLESLVKKVNAFYTEMSDKDLQDIDETKLQEYINKHKLSLDDLKSLYTKKWIRVES